MEMSVIILMHNFGTKVLIMIVQLHMKTRDSARLISNRSVPCSIQDKYSLSVVLAVLEGKYMYTCTCTCIALGYT